MADRPLPKKLFDCSKSFGYWYHSILKAFGYPMIELLWSGSLAEWALIIV